MRSRFCTILVAALAVVANARAARGQQRPLPPEPLDGVGHHIHFDIPAEPESVTIIQTQAALALDEESAFDTRPTEKSARRRPVDPAGVMTLHERLRLLS